jgi:hypothetical protein
MAESGRLKDAEEKFIEQTLPGIDYLAHYPGTIVSQSGQTFDFQPDSDRVPGLQGLTLNTGPGVSVTIDPLESPRATLFFANGDPGDPQLALGDTPGLVTYEISAAEEISLSAPSVKLGPAPTDFVIKGTAYLSALATFNSGFNAFLVALNPPGPPLTIAQVQAAAVTFLPFLEAFTSAAALTASVVTETT